MSHFFIKGEGGQPHQMLIMDVIGDSFWEEGVTAKEVVHALASVDENDEVKVLINSRGGVTDDGTVIYNTLADRPGTVNCYIVGYASSMATVVMCAADKTIAYETAMGMTHKALGARYGNADDMRAYADVLDKVTDQIALAYSRKMGKTQEEAKALLLEDGDQYRTAAELLEIGLVDEVVAPQKVAVLTDKAGAVALADGEGAALIDNPSQLPKAWLPHVEGAQGVVALRVDENAVSVIKTRAQAPAPDPAAQEEAGKPDDDPQGSGQQEGDSPPEGDQDSPDEQDPPAGGDGGDDSGADDEQEEPDPVAVERERVSAITAMATRFGVALDDDLIQGMLKDGTTAEQAGKMISAVAKSIGDSGSQSPVSNQPDPGAPEQSLWAAAGERAGVNRKTN